jgi:hypothetical protein
MMINLVIGQSILKFHYENNYLHKFAQIYLLVYLSLKNRIIFHVEIVDNRNKRFKLYNYEIRIIG